MNVRTQASSPAMSVALQGTSVPRFLTAFAARVSAADRYWSTVVGTTRANAALPAKLPSTSSARNASAGREVSPSRSRMVLLYCSRDSRRRGASGLLGPRILGTASEGITPGGSGGVGGVVVDGTIVPG